MEEGFIQNSNFVLTFKPMYYRKAIYVQNMTESIYTQM